MKSTDTPILAALLACITASRRNRSEKMLKKTMSSHKRRSALGASAFLVATVLALGGCAAQGPVKPAGLEQKIEAARTRADHQEIAAVYEQQAQGYKATAERHQYWAQAYERGRWKSKSMVPHCDNLARLFQQATTETLALAREHRQVAVQTKD